MSDALAQAVAAEIRAEKGRQRVSGRELARRMEEPVTTVNRWLAGGSKVGLDELDKIAAALEVDLVDLIRAARLQLMAKKLPRLDSNQQPAGHRNPQVAAWMLAEILPFPLLRAPAFGTPAGRAPRSQVLHVA